jgi:hypothetical protein
MKHNKSKKELKPPVEQEIYQAGWRVDKSDMHIFKAYLSGRRKTAIAAIWQ